MPSVNIIKSVPISNSPRILQVSSMFDIPIQDKVKFELNVDYSFTDREWNVGLIVGSSGSGKTLLGKELFGKEKLENLKSWSNRSVIENIDENISINKIIDAFSCIGFNTIPSWLKPFDVLSNGERFRVAIARLLLEEKSDPIVIDEFTSVVNREVGKITSLGVSKFARRNKRQVVAISCHSDVIDWLNPDWIIDTDSSTFQWRYLRRRPELHGTIQRVGRETWKLFSRYHYMSAKLHVSARCFGLFLDNRCVAFAGCLLRPISNPKKHQQKIIGVQRVVVLPDYQGLGLAFALLDKIGAAYSSLNCRFRTYPAHPGFCQSFDRSKNWMRIKKYGSFCHISTPGRGLKFGGWHNAVYEYVGPYMDDMESAKKLIDAA